MRWLLIAVFAAAVLWWLFRGRAAYVSDGPVVPGYTGTGDRTAQRPKARPWRG